ncbi:ribonuclease T2 family protein, partial [Entamoeba invadens IP1]
MYWPGEACDGKECSLPLGTTNIEENFFLHGLWPQLNANQNLFCCFYHNTIENIEEQMMKDDELKIDILNNFMSIEKCRFAGYQFEKHGTCALGEYNGENGALNYFKVSIELYKRFNIWTIFKESDLRVKTNKLIDINELKKVVEGVYGAKPSFVYKEKIYVNELRI